jgi:hypothetical protein
MIYGQYISLFGAVTLMTTIIMSSQGMADLSSPEYITAKKLYWSDNFPEAARAFRSYEATDSDWLSTHPQIKTAIDQVIDFCLNPPNIIVGNAKVTVVRPSPP